VCSSHCIYFLCYILSACTLVAYVNWHLYEYLDIWKSKKIKISYFSEVYRCLNFDTGGLIDVVGDGDPLQREAGSSGTLSAANQAGCSGCHDTRGLMIRRVV